MKSVKFAGELKNYNYNDIVVRYERGYLSRKTEINGDTTVYRSGDGRLFYYSPCFNSSAYKYRVYLVLDGRYLR